MQNVSRILVGIVSIPIVIALIFYLPVPFFILLVMILSGLGLYEYFSMVETDIVFPGWKAVLSLIGVSIPIAAYFLGIIGIVLLLFSVLAILLTLGMGTLPDYSLSFQSVGGLFLGFFLVVVPLSLAIMVLMSGPNGRCRALWMVLIVWAGDTGAFYLGTAFGKHRLYPRVSPKKSVEGVIGGMLSALAVGVVAGLFLATGFSWTEILVLPPILLLLGQLGDFSESMLKRGAGVKDSGKLLGGHGGILDRIDSFLFTIPFFYFYLLLRS